MMPAVVAILKPQEVRRSRAAEYAGVGRMPAASPSDQGALGRHWALVEAHLAKRQLKWRRGNILSWASPVERIPMARRSGKLWVNPSELACVERDARRQRAAALQRAASACMSTDGFASSGGHGNPPCQPMAILGLTCGGQHSGRPLALQRHRCWTQSSQSRGSRWGQRGSRWEGSDGGLSLHERHLYKRAVYQR